MLHNMFSKKQKQCVDFMAIKQEQHSKKQFRKVSKNAIKKELYMREIYYLLALAGRNLNKSQTLQTSLQGRLTQYSVIYYHHSSFRFMRNSCAESYRTWRKQHEVSTGKSILVLTSIKVNFDVNLRQFKGIFCQGEKKCAGRIGSHNKIRNLKL